MNTAGNWIIGVTTIIVAVLIAVLALVLPVTQFTFVRMLGTFVEIMLPFLAAGALIKYLLKEY